MTDQTTNAASNTEGESTVNANNTTDTTKVVTEGTTAEQKVTTEGTDTTTTEGDKKPAEGDDSNPLTKDDKKPEDDKKDDEKPVLKAPEKYELKPAEGVKLAPEVQTQFETIARELDLPQEAAQKLLDLAPEISKMHTKQLIETANAASDQWHEETRNDKELGGGGDEATYKQTMALVAKTRDALATPELRSLLQRFDAEKNPKGTGLGNHPEVVRLFARIGKSISEDNKVVFSDKNAPVSQADAAGKLYPSTNPKK